VEAPHGLCLWAPAAPLGRRLIDEVVLRGHTLRFRPGNAEAARQPPAVGHFHLSGPVYPNR
jgi:hypothetical protein